MSIGYLFELDASVSNGREYYACPGAQPKHWLISTDMQEVIGEASRIARVRKQKVCVYRLLHSSRALDREPYLVPTMVGAENFRGEVSIQWVTVESRGAAETVRDVRQGPSPYFGLQLHEECGE